MYKYFPHTEADISEMLGKIGLSSLDELYAEIPENIRFDKDYDLKKSMSEDEVRNYFRELGKTNKKLIPFAGAAKNVAGAFGGWGQTGNRQSSGGDRKSTRLNSSHDRQSRMPSSA